VIFARSSGDKENRNDLPETNGLAVWGRRTAELENDQEESGLAFANP
jgi:hypothetical protein